MVTIAPYGSWVSPIDAASLVSSGHPVSGGAFVGDEVWWLEARPTEGGRLAVRRRNEHGEPVDVLPAPWNARSRVHEYGGGAWAVTDAAALVFVNFDDQRLYLLAPGSVEPRPLTPAGLDVRFGDVSVVGDEVIAVRESHGVASHADDASQGTATESAPPEAAPSEAATNAVSRDIVAVALDGSGIRSLVSGSQFLAYPRVSPDGSHLVWVAWDHPQMPWDGTELRVGRLHDGALHDGAVHDWRVLAGSTTESVLQPEWADSASVYASSDRTGWWNLYHFDLDGSVTALHEVAADIGGPLWQLGAQRYLPLGDGRLLCSLTVGSDRIGILDEASGRLTELETPLSSCAVIAVRDGRALVLGGGVRLPAGLRELDVASGELRDIRLSVDDLPDADCLPTAQAMTFSGEREVHAFVYAPQNPDFAAPEGELPPFVAFVHGGPTGHTPPQLSLSYAFFTSRGIGVIEINYGGSSGYGRVYRERLRGQWGVVDVEDTITAVTALADAGLADPKRLAIRGGSAGGLTVLSALTGGDVFACGTSFFGVADMMALATDTHDFESRYLDGLVAPLPEGEQIYRDRSPVNRVDGLDCPVLLLQGLDDKVVPPSQSEAFRDALVRKGIPHAYIAYEGESHGFRKAETIIHSAQAELSFYGQVLGFDPPGVPLLPLQQGA